VHNSFFLFEVERLLVGGFKPFESKRPSLEVYERKLKGRGEASDVVGVRKIF